MFRTCFSIPSALGLSLILIIAGCSTTAPSSSGGGETEYTQKTGTVETPLTDGMKVYTSVGEWELEADGTFKASTLASGGSQLVIVENANGDPMLLGWLDDTRKTINAQSTAVVLAYYALGGYLFPFDNQQTLIEALEAEPSVQTLADTIEAAIQADDSCLVTYDSEGAASIREALTVMASALREKYGSASAMQKTNPLAKLAISPSDARSGLRVLSDSSTINTIEIVNEYRRRGYAYIEQVSWVRESDGAVVTTGTPLDDSPFWVEPTRGVGDGVIAVTEDIFEGIFDVGTFAYQPVSAGLFELPVPDGASKATYEVTIIGPGTGLGDVGDIDADQEARLLYVSAYSIVTDVLVPAIMNVAVPLKTYADGGTVWEDLTSAPSGMTILEDMTNILLDDPDVVTALTNGEYLEALQRSWELIVLGGAFQQSAKAFISYSVMAMNNWGVISSATMNDAMAMTYKMGRVLNGLALADIVLGAGDLGVVVAHIGLSDLANIWTVDALPAEVTLLPENSLIDPYGTVTLTAAVPELTGSTSTAEFTYHWSCSGNQGTITDSIGHTGTEFDSSSDFVAYIAEKGTSGGDTVTVTVTQIITGSGGTIEMEIGSAAATICVGDNCAWIEPDEADMHGGESLTLDMNVVVDEDRGGPEDLTYEWACDERYGTITAGGGETDATLTFRADFQAATRSETISVEAFLPDGSGGLESVGTAEATLSIQPPDITIDPVAPFLSPGDSVSLAASVTPEPDSTLDGVLSYSWSCTSSHGTMTSSDDTAMYTAGTSTTGSDTVEVEVTLTPPGGSSFTLGSAAVNVVVQSGTPGVPSKLELPKPSSAMSVSVGDTIEVVATITDSAGDPVQDVAVEYSISGVAHLDASSGLTNNNGQVRGVNMVINSNAGYAIVTATTDSGISDKALWVFGSEVVISPSSGELQTDNDIVNLQASVSPALAGFDMTYQWTLPQLPRNWADYVGSFDVDEDHPDKAVLYAGWAPGGTYSIHVSAVGKYMGQSIGLGSGSYTFSTVMDPGIAAPETWVETEDVEVTSTVTLYYATVYGGFRWSGTASRQYRYLTYKTDYPANMYGQEWYDSGIKCDIDATGEYSVHYYGGTKKVFESEADRADWITESLAGAQEYMIGFDNLEYQEIAEDWPPTEQACFSQLW